MTITETQKTAQLAADAAVSAAEAKQYMLEAEQGYQDTSAAAQQAQDAAGSALLSKQSAATSEENSLQYATEAGVARDEAVTAASNASEYAQNKFTFYKTASDPDGTIAGLAATTDGQSFWVAQGPDALSAAWQYQNKAGVAVLQAKQPGTAAITGTIREFPTLAAAQADADAGNIPVGSTAYYRSPDDSALAIEVINHGGTLEPTGRKMPSQESIDGRVYLSEGSELTRVIAAGKPVLIQDELGRVYLAGMEAPVQEVLDRTDETNNSSVHLNRDSAGNVVLLQDENGKLYAPGLNGSVQDELDRIRRKINSNRSPYLNVMPDALEAVWQRVDELGRLYLPGMTSGLQTQLSRNTERLRELANNRQVYDARDFGLRSEQGDRNEYIINGVINAAARNGGGVVYIPPGNWGLLNYITTRSGVSIIGAGTGATILRPRGSYAAIQRLPDDDSYLSDCLFQ
ncbi:glycosyl hydrolase family 28-related protein, partial [Klebsiella pneumoniae]|uniref:glycosyl hydrolase family 28-related protein n=1 Tax=Klebsiella pneumoniae TaxID=573 RepID=UPI003076540C